MGHRQEGTKKVAIIERCLLVEVPGVENLFFRLHFVWKEKG